MVCDTSSPQATISTFTRSQSFKPRFKKRPFLLLEILVSILLVSICLVPLVQRPIESYRAEMRLLEEIEGERLAEWSFSEIKEKLLNNEIPWEKLPLKGEKTTSIPLPSMTIEIPGAKPKKIERSFSLHCHKKGEKEGLKGEIYRMLDVKIEFTPRLSQNKNLKEYGDYSFRLIVQRKPASLNLSFERGPM